MKRFLVLCGAFFVSSLLVGCPSETRDGLVSDTIQRIELAATEIGNINSRVKEAIKQAETDNKKLDLTAALAAATKLKDTGDEAQKLKRRIEQVRSQITDEDRKAYAQKHKDALNVAFTSLLKKREELRLTLADAEKLHVPGAQVAVKEFREKLVEAESPFEALSR
jgi:hypothetical protein